MSMDSSTQYSSLGGAEQAVTTVNCDLQYMSIIIVRATPVVKGHCVAESANLICFSSFES